MFRRSLQLKEDDPKTHNNLGNVLASESRLEEAEKEYRRAIQIKEDDANAHSGLGSVLAGEGKQAEAEKEYRRAIQIKEDFAGFHSNLGVLLQDEGKFEEAIPSFQRALELLPRNASTRTLIQRNLSDCQHWLELDKKLPAVLNGEIQPKAPEKLEFAHLCGHYRGRYAAAARLFQEAFAEQPALADRLDAGHRYLAAYAAALAGLGKGEDASGLDEKERARLRNQALDWLHADLTASDKWRQDDAKARPWIYQRLQQLQADPNLAGVRDADALAKLPEAERAAWKKLWADVDALLAQMDAPKNP